VQKATLFIPIYLHHCSSVRNSLHVYPTYLPTNHERKDCVPWDRGAGGYSGGFSQAVTGETAPQRAPCNSRSPPEPLWLRPPPPPVSVRMGETRQVCTTYVSQSGGYGAIKYPSSSFSLLLSSTPSLCLSPSSSHTSATHLQWREAARVRLPRIEARLQENSHSARLIGSTG
jgi:hypothetical protein